jgi:hypothetical protein
MKSTWTKTSPTSLLVNGGFDADSTYAIGWTLSNATVAISSGACAVTATSAGGRIYQTLSGLRPDTEYRVGVSINGGANANAGRLYTTGAARNFDQTFTTTDYADVGGVFKTDASGTAVVISLSVISNGEAVTFDHAYVFTGNVQFAYSGNALDMWRHKDAPTKIDGGDIQPTSVAVGALPNQNANTVLAGPTTGAATAPAFRALVAADIPGRFVRLQAPLTSTSWDGDAKTTADSGILDLSAVFTAPAGITAALVAAYIKDASVSQAMSLGPTSTYNNALGLSTQVANVYLYHQGIVPCDNNGDFYVKFWHDMDNVGIEIWGYWL